MSNNIVSPQITNQTGNSESSVGAVKPDRVALVWNCCEVIRRDLEKIGLELEF